MDSSTPSFRRLTPTRLPSTPRASPPGLEKAPSAARVSLSSPGPTDTRDTVVAAATDAKAHTVRWRDPAVALEKMLRQRVVRVQAASQPSVVGSRLRQPLTHSRAQAPAKVEDWSLRKLVQVANAHEVDLARAAPPAAKGTAQALVRGLPGTQGVDAARNGPCVPLQIARTGTLVIGKLHTGVGLCIVAAGQAIAFADITHTRALGLEAVQRAREFIKCTRLGHARLRVVFNLHGVLRALYLRRDALMAHMAPAESIKAVAAECDSRFPDCIDKLQALLGADRSAAAKWIRLTQIVANSETFAIKSQARKLGIEAVRIDEGPWQLGLDGELRRPR